MSQKPAESKPPDYMIARNQYGMRAIVDSANNRVIETFGQTVSHIFLKQRLSELWKEELGQ